MNKIDEQTVIRFYQYFYKKKYQSPKYVFKPSDKAKKSISNFVKKLDKFYGLQFIGENFLWDYFVYQFNYWRSAELTSFYGKFRIEYIIGDKALKRFKENIYDNLWVIQGSEIIDSYGLKKKDLIKEKVTSYTTSHEEVLKKRYFNTTKGFYSCIAHTTLYNHKHTSCILCGFKGDCKKILKENYPKIYEKRGYNADSY